MYNTFPLGDSFMFSGEIPRENGGPTAARAPVDESMENTEMEGLLAPMLPTYRKLPPGSIASKVGVVALLPTCVRGVTSVIVPELAIVNNEISASAEFAAYRNFLEGWTATASTAGPAAVGLVVNAVRMPELGSSRYAKIWLAPGTAAYTKRLTVEPQLIHVARL